MSQDAAVIDLLENKSKPVKMKPILYTINGIGFGFAGTALRHPDLGSDMFVGMHWFQFVLVPILPLGIYLLSKPIDDRGRTKGDQYYIHRAVQIGGVTSVWGLWRFLGMFLSAWGIVLAVIGGFIVVAAIYAVVNG